MKNEQKRIVLHQMKSIYYPKGLPYLDWMGYPITEKNCPSYHHIYKAEYLRNNGMDDKATMANGAYLGKKSHEMLHYIEKLDKDLYECWNHLFLLINKMGCYPIDDVWKMVFRLKESSEELIKKDKISKKGLKF